MTSTSLILLLVFSLAWWLAFTVSFYLVDRQEARSRLIIAGNLIQAIFHLFLPLVPIAKAFDDTLQPIEIRAFRYFSVSLVALAVVIILIELLS